MFVGAGIWCIPSNRGGRLDTVSLYWISLFLWFDYATSPTKRYRPQRLLTNLSVWTYCVSNTLSRDKLDACCSDAGLLEVIFIGTFQCLLWNILLWSIMMLSL